MSTERIIEKIKKFLGDKPRNTAEILEHINSSMRHGTTSQQLGNVLSKDKDIVKIGYIKQTGILSGGYDICEWATRDWVSKHIPGWADEVKVNDNKQHLNYTFSDEDNPLFGFLEGINLKWSNVYFGYLETKMVERPIHENKEVLQHFFDREKEFTDFKTKALFLIRFADYLVGQATGREHGNGRMTKNLVSAIQCYSEAINLCKVEDDRYLQVDHVENSTYIPMMIAYNNQGLAYLLLREFEDAYACFDTSRRFLSTLVRTNKINSLSKWAQLENLIHDNIQIYWKLRIQSSEKNPPHGKNTSLSSPKLGSKFISK